MILIRFFVLIIRMLLDVLDAVLRVMCWALEHVCLGLEWGSAHLRPQPLPARLPKITDTSRRAKAEPQPKELSEVDKMQIALGDKGRRDPQVRALAEQMLASKISRNGHGP